MLSKAILFSILFLSVNAHAIDKINYMLGDFHVDGFDTSAEQKYQAKVTVKKSFATGKKIVFHNVFIEHGKDSGLGTYYGVITGFKNNTLTIDYQNAGKQSHKVTCHYSVKANKLSLFKCKGSWLGNLGGDGTFVMNKISDGNKR